MPSFPQVRGYYYDDIVTTGGVSVNLRFGVGDSWAIPPFLGLGISLPQEKDASSLSYTTALVEQNKIAEPYIGLYDIRNPCGTKGEIVIGGVDRKKIYGSFSSWNGIGAAGEVPTPKVKVVTNDGHFNDLYNRFVQPRNLTALISPGTPFIVVPSDVLESLRLAVPIAFPLGNSDIKKYLYTKCDGTIDPSFALEFDFQTLVIRIPLEDLKTVAPPRIYSNIGGFVSDESNVCVRAYVVMKPGNTRSNSMTAIAIAKPNATEQEIIELGGQNSPSLDDISGDEPAASERKKKIIIAAAAGAGGGGGFLLIILVIFCHRFRKKYNLAVQPSVPSPDPDFVWQPQAHGPHNQGGQAVRPLDPKADESTSRDSTTNIKFAGHLKPNFRN
ncbi:hypothetical protein TWF506_009320 [Arthrobotrys conoides]|uniref:Peptidase A1 domain-containing protein n=1 Tax=Arthrobotrys conoides TaxID=74498 RepID=A0AAN8N8G9_9PEZI